MLSHIGRESVGTHAVPHIAHTMQALGSQGDPAEKCFGALEGMCLMSLATATVACLGLTQQGKTRHLGCATIVTTAEQTGEDKERQKTKRKAKPLL